MHVPPPYGLDVTANMHELRQIGFHNRYAPFQKMSAIGIVSLPGMVHMDSATVLTFSITLSFSRVDYTILAYLSASLFLYFGGKISC